MSRSRLVKRMASPVSNVSVTSILESRRRPKPKHILSHTVVPAPSGYSLMKFIKLAPLLRQGRDDGYLHVSDLVHKCVRSLALSKRIGMPMPTQEIYDSQGITFAQGDAIQSFVTNKLIRHSSDFVYGKWACRCGAKVKEGVYSTVVKEECSVCNTHLDNYQEVAIKNDEYMISGSIDILLLTETQHFYTGEVKSMVRHLWDKLTRPVPEHAIQVLFYWWLLREAGYNLLDKVSIIYVCKEMQFKSPYKEFSIIPSREIHQLDEYLQDAANYKSAVTTGEQLPIRSICVNENSPAAKKCQVCYHCFSTD